MPVLLSLFPAALAVPACDATAVCAPTDDPCVVDVFYEIGDGCVLDFGDRAVEVTARGRLDVQTFAATLLAGDLTVATGGEIVGKEGGDWTVRLSGGFVLDGTVDHSTADPLASGTFDLAAAGDVLVSGALRAQARARDASGGVIRLSAGGALATEPTIDVSGGTEGAGGAISLRAAGPVTIDGSLNADGGTYDGGTVFVGSRATLSTLSGTISADGGGDAGSGGAIRLVADGDVLSDAIVHADGDAGLDGWGGWGGVVAVISHGGNAVVTGALGAHGAPDDGEGGVVRVWAGGDAVLTGTVDVNATGSSATGGQVLVHGEVAADVDATIGADGGDGGGGTVTIRGGASVAVDGAIHANGGGSGGDGGAIRIFGDDAFVAARLDPQPDPLGYGGRIDVRACWLEVPQGTVWSNDAPGGVTTLRVRESAYLDGTSRASENLLAIRAGQVADEGPHATFTAPLLVTEDPALRTCVCPGGDADADGVCDRDDLCPGGDDAVDQDADGWPDACPLSITVDPPLQVGVQSVVTVRGARPNHAVRLVSGTGVGFSGVDLCVLSVVGWRTGPETNRADADGVARFRFTPDPADAGVALFAEAWDPWTCRTTGALPGSPISSGP